MSVKDATMHADLPPAANAVDDRFAQFYRAEYDRAVRLAWLLTGSRAAAEDVVQDAMTGVYRGFDRVESPTAYLRRAVVNRARSRRRDERRQQERADLLERERGDRGGQPEDSRLLELIGQLPYRQRAVVVARYWGDWSETEIADAIGARPGTVKSLAARALDRLRREVER